MKYFDKHIFYQIIKCLSNTDLLNFFLINKYINGILHLKQIVQYLYHRPHPIVFNLIDNYCILCNISKSYLFSNNCISRCNHIKF